MLLIKICACGSIGFSKVWVLTAILPFETLYLQNTYTPQIIQKYAFDRIPELLNVIRGEMLLFGYNSLTIKDAAKLTFKQQKQLNKMPALISIYSHLNN